ncbi:ABC transporter permease [Plebeiibacterium marinum]|uniref:FtsX-like permease family protein n=1 Tax=Plebeiibacterium marinum TaxID=2992111 RepID=A0AAE3SJT7_9BACT|nr:FtsX-like permease family protein [Plebeiobacterium marinum]MCW3805839.1 FtsX-like permease family protein [Plebeiobacterium marinum]
MILKIAWRNIWRNPLRSWIVIAALIVGMYAGVFTTTFMYGWMMQRLKSGIETETSHIQIQKPGFKLAEDVNLFFESDTLIRDLERQGDIVCASGRLVVSAMVASAEKAVGIQVLGVDAGKDSLVVDVSEKLVEGAWFSGVKRHPVVVGQELAKELKLKLRSKLIVRFQDCNGDFTGGAFRVAGIFKTNNTGFDGGNMFVRDADLQKLLLIPKGMSHQIVIRCTDPTRVDIVRNSIEQFAKGLRVESWREISPELGYITETMNAYMYVFVMIILMALGFGVVNTMLMVVMERVHEIGMLMAIGMKRHQIFQMIVYETSMLALVGGLIGVAAGIITTHWTGKSGINLSMWAEGLAEMGYDSIIYPQYNFQMVSGVVGLVLFTGLVASVYPAIKALKLNPSQALQSV